MLITTKYVVGQNYLYRTHFSSSYRLWSPRSCDAVNDSHGKWGRDLWAGSLSDLTGGHSGMGFDCGGSASWPAWPCRWTVCPRGPCERSSPQSPPSPPCWRIPRSAAATRLWSSQSQHRVILVCIVPPYHHNIPDTDVCHSIQYLYTIYKYNKNSNYFLVLFLILSVSFYLHILLLFLDS